jgi:hypothetical protein
VIRRGFWLAAGAVLGVAGYRRATRLARALTGQQPTRTGQPGAHRAVSVQPGAHRAGTAQPAGQRARTAAAGLVSAAGFAKDVRDGMAEYWDLHRDELANPRTLGSQSAPPRSRHGA